MVAPPGPTSTTSQAALAKLKLVKTPAGIAIFMVKFPSALGPLLASTLRSALRGSLDKSDTRAIALLELIYDALIGTMPDDKDVVKMTKDCGTDGHECLEWLQRKYAPTTTASSIKALLGIFQEPFGNDVVAGIEDKIAANDALPDTVTISDPILAILLLAKMPPELSNLVDIIVERDAMPTCDEIRDKVFNQVSLHDVKNKQLHAAFSFTGQGYCYNCDTQGHTRRNCTKPKTDCSECGKAAGHPDKYCLVINAEKDIPLALSAERRVKIIEARKARAAKKGTGMLLCSDNMSGTEIHPEDDNFWDMLERLNQQGLNFP